MEKNELLQRIAKHHVLNASFCFDLGLFRGRMGCVIFFFHYARYTGEGLYEDFAGELLDDLYEDIHTETPVYFQNGLCGIAWGIEYLIHQKFVEGDTNDILVDIDKKIMERDLRRITDYTLETGLEGIAWYILSRLSSDQNKVFDTVYLNDFKQACDCLEIEKQTEGIRLFLDYIEGKKFDTSFSSIINKLAIVPEDISDDDLRWQRGLKMLLS